jgi:hypothetical protein
MSKAEEKAIQYCCTKCENNKLNCGMKLISNGRNCIECSNYTEGYHQAEKDNELTWEDVRDILNLYEEVIEMDFCEDIYGEVLKRFKERKHGDKG